MALWWAAVQAEPPLMDPSSEALTRTEQPQTDTTESAAFVAETGIKSSTGPNADGVPAELAQIRGLIQPVNEATLSSELLAKIVEFPFRDGEHFKAKDVLVRFDCSRLGAELNAARAAYAAGKKKYENNAELARYNAAATLEVEVSKAEASEASAPDERQGCHDERMYRARALVGASRRDQGAQT